MVFNTLYTAIDHLGKTSSNLPGLFYIGLPFYLLGNVSLLQPFVFLLMAIVVYKTTIFSHKKVLFLFLLLTSPAYLWEIVAKSDLMSNLFLVLLFIYGWSFKYKENFFKKPILLAFCCAFLLLTRGIVLVSLTLFLFADFLKSSKIVKIKFMVFFILFLFLISAPVLITIPNFETLLQYNPINHQTRYAPKMLQFLIIVFTFIVAVRVKNVKEVVAFSTLILTGLLFLTFLINIAEEGFEKNLYGNLFDISYLGMILPFLIFLPVFSNKNTMRA